MALIAAAALVIAGVARAQQIPTDPFAPPPGLSAADLAAYERGRLVFNAHWRPSGTDGPDDFEGLGPLYNRISCSSCHNAGGRGRAPANVREPFLTALVRVGKVGADGSVGPHPLFGEQIQDRALPDMPLEGRIRLRWEYMPGRYPDGNRYVLRRPTLSVQPDPGPDTVFSVRIAQPVRGLGRLEGRGGFGWKGAQPDLRHQNAAAFSGDMGLTTSLFPIAECPGADTGCGGGPNEVGDGRLDDVTHFVRMMTPLPPLDPNPDPKAVSLFEEVGCAACHDTGTRAKSDMALHDMGPGLDDGLPEGAAKSSEWRTPPLWGLGSVLAENPAAPLLHDGRARGVEEAILWHGGEAESAAKAFKALPAADRARLIAYLGGL